MCLCSSFRQLNTNWQSCCLLLKISQRICRLQRLLGILHILWIGYLSEEHFFLWSPNSSWKPAPCHTCNFLFSCAKCLSIYLTCKFYKQEYTLFFLLCFLVFCLVLGFGFWWVLFLVFFFVKTRNRRFFPVCCLWIEKKMNMTEMLKKPSSSQAQKSQTSTGPSSTMHTTFPRPHSLYSLGSGSSFDLSMEHNTKYIWQFCQYRDLGWTSRWVKICIFQLPAFIKMSY